MKMPEQQIEQQQQQQQTKSLKMDENNEQNNIQKSIQKQQQKQSETVISFLRAARSGDLEKVLEYLDKEQILDINASNANGLNALHLCAKDGYLNMARELLERGIKVNNATKKGNTALHIASLAGQIDIIKLLLQYNANVNVQSLNGFTPLYMAAQENHDACVTLLLSKGANPALATEDGFTPLAVAMQQGHDRVVSVLLESDMRGKVRLPALHIAAKKNDINAATLLMQHDPNPDIVSKSGFTPLHIAAHYGNVAIAQELIEHGADVNFKAKHNITPMHVASKWGKTEIIELLLAHGAAINATTRDGLTPLHCAARSGHVGVIELLLQHGAPILSKTKNGLAPLHMAAQGEHDEAANLLLQYKVPVDEVTVDYLTALHVAAHCGHVRVAKLLLAFKADANARALNGFTPLHIACKKNRLKLVELLLQHGANIGATTESGLTPLHVASFMGCLHIVIYLLQHDAAVDVQTVRQETPLHLAVRAQQTDIVRILLRQNASVNKQAREGQSALHVAARLGNLDIISLLIQQGADVNMASKDGHTPLHIAAKEGQLEVAQLLIENGAHLNAETRKLLTPLHLAAKYGQIEMVRFFVQQNANINAKERNDLTPLMLAALYEQQDVGTLLLNEGAQTNLVAKNGHCVLHIAAKRNQMELAQQILQLEPDLLRVKSKAGFTPLHLASQESHLDMVQLLLEQENAPIDVAAKNGLTPLHLTAQQDRGVPIARVLLEHNADISARTKSGYTPLHIAAHYGQIYMVKFLLENDANIELTTNTGYTPLHQAAQQGNTLIINLLLKHKANPNATTNNGQTAKNIAENLGYITAMETLKVVTETSITNSIHEESTTEKYKVVAPEFMHETVLTDSEDDASDEQLDHHQYKYMANDDLKGSNEQDNKNFDTTNNEDHHQDGVHESLIEAKIKSTLNTVDTTDNVAIVNPPIHLGFLVSFLVDARGGSMRGCRHNGVRVVVPPKACLQPTRITCRYVKPQRVHNPPPLMENEALVSRVMELSPVDAKFSRPVVLEVPHFGSLRGKEREIVILRSDNGDTWREHTVAEGEDGTNMPITESNNSIINALEDLHTTRIVRIVTSTFPQFFAVVSRIRQEVYAIGPEGGTVISQSVPLVRAIFPPQALTKKIRVGLQAQPIDLQDCSKLVGQGVAVSPVVTIEPRRRKFHKAITLSIPAPKSCIQSMVNAPTSTSTLRLLCSITGGQNQAVWEDVSGSTPLAFVRDSVTFTTTVSARFWLMDCRHISEVSRLAAKLYSYMSQVPFMVKFVVFAKWSPGDDEAKISIFCMTDDKEDKTLEQKEGFKEIAKSRDVEILENQLIYLDFSGNLSPVLKTGEQLNFKFCAFRENRLQFTLHVKDQNEPTALLYLLNSSTTITNTTTTTTANANQQQQQPNKPICVLGVNLIMKDNDDQLKNNNNPNIDTIKTVNNNSKDDHNILDAGRNYRDLINAKYKLEQQKKQNLQQEEKQHLQQQQQHQQLEQEEKTLINNDNIQTILNNNDDIVHLEKIDISLKDVCNLLKNDWYKLANKLEIVEKDIDIIRSQYADNSVEQATMMLRLWLKEQDAEAAGNKLEQALLDIQREDIVQYCMKNTLQQEGHHLEFNSANNSLNGNFKEKDIVKEEELTEPTNNLDARTTGENY